MHHTEHQKTLAGATIDGGSLTNRALLAASCMLFLFLTPSHSQESNKLDWSELNKKGLEYARSNNYKQAKEAFQAALNAIKKRSPVDTVQEGLLLNNMGFVCLELGDYQLAEPTLKESLQLLTGNRLADPHDLANANENLGRLFWRRGQFDTARPLLLKALALQEGLNDLSPDFRATRYANLAKFYSQQGEYATAESYLHKAVELRRKSKTPDPELWQCLVDLADAIFSQGKKQEAKALLSEALLLAEKQIGPNSEEVTVLKARVRDADLAQRPDFEILSPKPNELFKAHPILVQVDVHNFQLKLPQPIFGKAPDNSSGHIHYLLDDHPPLATNATQVMMEGGPAFLREGEHTLWVELVDETHHSLAPPVRHTVRFSTEN